MRILPRALSILVPVILAACATSTKQQSTSTTNPGPLKGLAEFQALPSQPADYRIAYGEDPSQYAELKVPSSAGPHPVVILIHGGCWKAAYATLRDLAPMADALKADGIAAWNIEYRRLPQPGSGWPGTYLDVGRAVDHLRSIAKERRLDLSRVVVLGHSAGGHLALWTAARARLPKESPLFVPGPLPIGGVINLAGYGDMEAFIPAETAGCNDAVVEAMLGGKPAIFPERYAQTSAIMMLPLGVRQVLIWGQRDEIAPIRLGENYVKAALKAGDTVRLEIIPTLGHFEIASPQSPAWSNVRDALRSLLKLNQEVGATSKDLSNDKL